MNTLVKIIKKKTQCSIIRKHEGSGWDFKSFAQRVDGENITGREITVGGIIIDCCSGIHQIIDMLTTYVFYVFCHFLYSEENSMTILY